MTHCSVLILHDLQPLIFPPPTLLVHVKLAGTSSCRRALHVLHHLRWRSYSSLFGRSGQLDLPVRFLKQSLDLQYRLCVSFDSITRNHRTAPCRRVLVTFQGRRSWGRIEEHQRTSRLRYSAGVSLTRFEGPASAPGSADGERSRISGDTDRSAAYTISGDH